MSWALQLIAAGVALAALLAAVAGAVRGVDGLTASACGSAVALAAQVAAVGLLRPVMGGRTPAFMRRWVGGMAVRGCSALVLVGLVLVLRGSLPAVWMVAGYLGVLLPLLFVETRYLR